MTSLYETALNGMMVGQKASDLNQMHKDCEEAGAKLEAEILLKIGVAMMDLQSSDRMAASAALNLGTALARYRENSSVSNAEWLTHYAQAAEKHSRESQAIYSRIGELWAIWKLTQA